MELRTTSINFPTLRGNGPIIKTADVHFPREVNKAIAGITGYSAGFSGKHDHHLGKLQVQLSTVIDGDLVKVNGTFGLRDWSGNWDDDYEGNIEILVVAELADASEPRPRGDLTITGMEFTQATQHFRSYQHLDAVNVRPDNSIPLISRKDTAVRVYVDYDRNSGLPVINNLSGELIVDTGFTTITLSPQNIISPLRDNQINRGQIDNTLNFVIPENFCQNQLVLRCRVFDQLNPSPASRKFERTIYFDNRVPLNLYAVGVHYTGQSLDLAAPTLTDIISTDAFSKMEVVYPVPEVLITGYTEIEFNKDMKADINDGCGDGYSSLLDTLRDMQGSSNDVYYGFLPNGFDGGSVGGCGGGSGRVAASPFTAFGGLAQETGHAFDRNHAPCDNSMRCGNPANQDGDYPQYAEFDSDSIGEFGYNPRTDDLFSPVNSHDFMSYSGNRWVSPYTYMGLLGAFASSEGMTALMLRMQQSSSFGEIGRSRTPQVTEGPWIRTEMMKLFLWLEIDRKRNVKRLPSFHFNTKQVNNLEEPSDFTVELLDENGNRVTCQPLRAECADCNNCWPKSIRQYIPYNEKARRLIVYENDEIIYEEEIVKADDHYLTTEYDETQEGFKIEWSEKSENNTEHWYLIHWQDYDGQWRGLSKRTTDKKAFIPSVLFGRRKKMKIRLLCSAGISTKIAEETLTLPAPPESDVVIAPVGSKNIHNWLTVALFENNKMVPGAEIIWYNDNHTEIGRGRSINLKVTRDANNITYAVALYNGKRYENTFIRNTNKIKALKPLLNKININRK